MRKSRFSDEQVVAILREADRMSVADAAKKCKVSEQKVYVWRKHFAGLTPADVKRLHQAGSAPQDLGPPPAALRL